MRLERVHRVQLDVLSSKEGAGIMYNSMPPTVCCSGIVSMPLDPQLLAALRGFASPEPAHELDSDTDGGWAWQSRDRTLRKADHDE